MKNDEMEQKLREAFKKQGTDPPSTKKKKNQPEDPRTLPSTRVIRKKAKAKKKKPQRRIYPPTTKKPSIQPSISSFGIYHKGEQAGSNNGSIGQAVLTPLSDQPFRIYQSLQPNSSKGANNFITPGVISTQFSGAQKRGEIELVIGLDFGTSNTKVVIGDPANKRYFAVPFEFDAANPYLAPTIFGVDEYGGAVLGMKSGCRHFQSLKLQFMDENLSEAVSGQVKIYIISYLASVLRHAIGWFISVMADSYKDMEIVWQLCLGLPAAKLKMRQLKYKFHEIGVAAAQVAISNSPTINTFRAKSVFERVKADIAAIVDGEREYSEFETLGSDAGVVVVVPEIAAQVIGFYRSRRWDPSYPFTFIIDVGAGTVDAAVFSVADPAMAENDLKFCAFSCAVEELGVVNLHLRRIEFLLEHLPSNVRDHSQIQEFLKKARAFRFSNLKIPESIDEYVNNIKINETTGIPTPDRQFQSEMSRTIYHGVLMQAYKKSEGDRAWDNLRTIVCGGGSRAPLYSKFVNNIARNSRFNTVLTAIEMPANLSAPKLEVEEYDRLSVAYGLAQGTYWEYEWPEDIDESRVVKRDYSEFFISKDMV